MRNKKFMRYEDLSKQIFVISDENDSGDDAFEQEFKNDLSKQAYISPKQQSLHNNQIDAVKTKKDNQAIDQINHFSDNEKNKHAHTIVDLQYRTPQAQNSSVVFHKQIVSPNNKTVSGHPF